MNAVWANLEGHVVNGVFPLHRCVGSSPQSAVFRTESAKHAPSALALKLVRIDDLLSADAQLSRWRAAADLSHPHLIRMFEVGQCQVGELHLLYALMEYADQHLAQLLEQRALTEHEAREMLAPTLSALAHLHQNKFVQGRLKPSNILVVGEQLKLASDTVRTVGKAAGAVQAASMYDAPESRDGIVGAAGDIWALGVTMCQALTRQLPSGLHEGAGPIELPADLRPPLREVVARCLSRDPRDRPDVADLQAWLRGERTISATPEASQAAAAPLQTAAMPESGDESQPKKASTLRLVIRAEIIPEAEPPSVVREHSKRRALLLVLLAAAVLSLIWIGISVFRSDPMSEPAASDEPSAVESQSPAPAAPTTTSDEPPAQPITPKTEPRSAARAPVAPAPVTPPATEPQSNQSQARQQPAASPSAINEVIPDVPHSALQTIRGTVRVSIRVIVDRQGAVLAATPEDPGPSRYFERLSLAAARKWTFTPADTQQRVMLVQFNFRRDGVTARSSPVP